MEIPIEISRLSVADRIQLVEDIWDSIAAESQNIPLPQSQKDELDRRIAAQSSATFTWDQVKARARGITTP